MSQDEVDLVLELFGGQLMGPAFRIARCRDKRIISSGVRQFQFKGQAEVEKPSGPRSKQHAGRRLADQ